MTTTVEIKSFVEGQLNFLERQHQQLEPAKPFDEFLAGLPDAACPDFYWDHESTIIRHYLFGHFGDFGIFESFSAINRELEVRGLPLQLIGGWGPSGEECFFMSV
jgi:hypothetical protein